MSSMTFSPVEAAVLTAVRQLTPYRSVLERHLDGVFSVEEIDRALEVLLRHKLIVQWGGSLGRSRQFFLATGRGVQLHAEYTAQNLAGWVGVFYAA
jgi:hypothetical protein